MNLVFYSDKNESEGLQLQRALKSPFRGKKARNFRTVASLESYLKNFPRPETAVLMAADSHELAHLIKLRKYFEEVPVILILPDRSEDTLNQGCALGALMTCFRDGMYEDVSAMLSRLRTMRQAARDQMDPRRFSWNGAIPYLSSFSPYENADAYTPAEAGFYA